MNFRPNMPIVCRLIEYVTHISGPAMKYASLKYDNTTNLGDQIQSFAAEQYLPNLDRRFDRDSLASASADGKHLLIMNGWFSHSPLSCFPPSDTIVPVFVGFHIADAPEKQSQCDDM